jgi:hypothetical protein
MRLKLPGGYAATVTRRVHVVTDLVVVDPAGDEDMVCCGLPEAEVEKTLNALREALVAQTSEPEDVPQKRGWTMLAVAAIAALCAFVAIRIARRRRARHDDYICRDRFLADGEEDLDDVLPRREARR